MSDASAVAARYVQAPTTLARMTLTGVLLLPEGRSEPVLVTSPGDAVWALLERPATVAEITATLAREFTADPTEIATDIDALIAHLLSLEAIQQAPDH